ncbi:MAG: hypothetical protein KGH89_00330 [Thaumarchaeota archaeon]|nr:hypothetical protein [Nitrososphaerota archaeon]
MPSGNDVFWGGQEAAKYLLNGTNIYNATYYVYNNPVWAGVPFKVYTYLPGTTIFEALFYSIFADIRYAIMFADTGIAILLYLIIRKKNEDYGRAAMSFYLLAMALTFVAPSRVFDTRISDGLTDPIWCVMLLSAIYLSMKNQKLAAAIFVGYALATKQFAILFFIPIAILWLKKDVNFKRDYRSIVISVGVATAIILPFFLWSPSNFVNGTMTSLPSQGIAISLGQPQWNMSIPAQMTFFGINIGVRITHIIQIAVIGGLLVALRNKITNIFSATLVFVVIYTIFLSFNNFTQYFYWLSIIPYILIAFSHSFTDYVKKDDNHS